MCIQDKKIPDFRVRLETKDGQLVQDRRADSKMYFRHTHCHRGKCRKTFDDEWARHVFAIDCREKGVKLLSYSFNDKGVFGIVEWLGAKA